MKNEILLTWLGTKSDPYSKDHKGDDIVDSNGNKECGPTLNLLFSDQSFCKNKIKHICLFHGDNEREKKQAEELRQAIHEKDRSIYVESILRPSSDPTDHQKIYSFLKQEIPQLRGRFSTEKFIVHVSPGTPSMHTIWVLMVETGMIPGPVELVKAYREGESKNKPPVAAFNVGIETFFKAFRTSKPQNVSDIEQGLNWDPSEFQSKELKELYRTAEKYAKMKIPVLILGEKGTGKTTMANWIRANSPFRKKQLDNKWPVMVCGQYSGDTMRSELMGYVENSFTGAAKKGREGIIAQADGDTLFLDEIGDINRDMQRLLIRAIEEKSYTPIGSSETKKSDFRLITATNRSWESLCDTLDPDFIDRLSYLTLTLPPLRKIPEDLPLIWNKIFRQALQKACVELSSKLLETIPHQQIIKRLRQHPLKGNFRDLYQVAYQLIAECIDQDQFDPKSIEKAFQSLRDESGNPSFNSRKTQQTIESFIDTLCLEKVILQEEKIQTKQLDKQLKIQLAQRLKQIAKTSGKKIETICDVTTRTLDKWLEKNN